MRPEEFIHLVTEGAQKFQVETGVFASVTIAQAALETGWGKSIPADIDTGKVSNNLFGVKGEGPAGCVYCWTEEVYNSVWQKVKDYFRAYNTIAESIADHGEVLTHARYNRVRDAGSPEEACRMLQECGYATDPGYASKLAGIISYNNLTRYDLSKEEVKVIKELADRLAKLEAEVAAQRAQLEAYNDQTIATWAANAVTIARDKKLIEGDGASWNPNRPLTRQEFATVLYRLGLL